MPEWIAPMGLGLLFAALGWLIVNKLNCIDAKQTELGKKLDRYEERQAKVEKDCLTWEQFREEMGPLKTNVAKHDKDILAIKVVCEQRHKA